jgi:molecular chaperone DnaK (HSP70)
VAQTNGNAECLANDKDFNDNVSLVVFDAWTDHLVECLEAPITAALAAAGEKTSAMQTVEIVSGGRRVLAVKTVIAKLLRLAKTRPNFGLASPRP